MTDTLKFNDSYLYSNVAISKTSFMSPDTSEFSKRLKSVAEKLDVKPLDENSSYIFRMVLVTSDGAKYDAMEMMEKFLTKMDEKL